MKIKLNWSVIKKDWFLLAGITALAFVLRILLAASFSCLTFDEMISFSVAGKPLSEIWSYVRWEMHPPLHYYFLHFWLQLFGATEVSAHFSSIFLSILAVIALYFLGKEIFSSRLAGLSAAAFYAFSPLFCFYGAWARMYTMLFLTATLSFLFFFKLLKTRGQPAVINGALFSFFTLAALFTHLTAGLVLVIEFFYLLYLIIARKNKLTEILKKFIIPAALITLTYGWWFWHFWQSRLNSLSADAWYFSTRGKENAFITIFYYLLKYLTPSNQFILNALALSLLVILGFSAFALLISVKGGGWKIKSNFSSGAFFALLIIFLSFLGLFAAKLLILRYAIVPAVGFFLLLGGGFSRAQRSWQAVAVFIFLVLSVLSFASMANVSSISGDWRGGANFISENERPGDKIIGSLYSDLFLFGFYYHGRLPMAAPLDEKYQGDNLLLTVVKTNIYPTTNQENVGQLKNFITDARRIFLAAPNTSEQAAFFESFIITRDWLLKQGFVSVQSWPPGPASSSLVWILEKK
jgi:uncharacterized membrane protein